VLADALETASERLEQSPIRVVWDPPSAPCVVLGGDGEIQQVLVNLIGNAADAMAPEGGTLKLTLEGTDAAYRIEVADDGPGIPAEQLERIFQPFFSTKAGQGGTGLGLLLHELHRTRVGSGSTSSVSASSHRGRPIGSSST
jgi:signal transduction histidine kinase